MSNNGRLIILSGPSGSGKSTLAGRVLERLPQLTFSVSYTTRSPRPGETDGVEYFFVSQPRFASMIEQGAFLEHARVYGEWYGTSRGQVDAQVKSGIDVLLDIDVQGALQVKKQVPKALTIFVLPPSRSELETRLRQRAQDDPRAIEKRLVTASREIRFYREYAYLLINDSLDRSVDELQSIILASRCRLQSRRTEAKRIVETFLTREEDTN